MNQKIYALLALLAFHLSAVVVYGSNATCPDIAAVWTSCQTQMIVSVSGEEVSRVHVVWEGGEERFVSILDSSNAPDDGIAFFLMTNISQAFPMVDLMAANTLNRVGSEFVLDATDSQFSVHEDFNRYVSCVNSSYVYAKEGTFEYDGRSERIEQVRILKNIDDDPYKLLLRNIVKIKTDGAPALVNELQTVCTVKETQDLVPTPEVDLPRITAPFHIAE